MRIEIQLRIVADDNSVISEGEIVQFDKGDDRLEGIGLLSNELTAGRRWPASREAWSPPRRQVFWRGIGVVISAAACCSAKRTRFLDQAVSINGRASKRTAFVLFALAFTRRKKPRIIGCGAKSIYADPFIEEMN